MKTRANCFGWTFAFLACAGLLGAQEKGSGSSYKFVNKTEAREGGQVLSSAIEDDRSLVFNAEEVSLIHVYNAVAKPMNHRDGVPEEDRTAFAKSSLQGKNNGIFLWGPYKKLQPGRHIVVYRFKFLQELDKKEACFLDVCHGLITYSWRRPHAKSVSPRVWHEIAVPVDVPKEMGFEYRFWPRNQQVAIDRIYVYRIKERNLANAPVSIMGSVKWPTSLTIPKTGVTAKVAIVEAGGYQTRASKEVIGIWRLVDGQYKRLPADDVSADTLVLPGDILWIPSEKGLKQLDK